MNALAKGAAGRLSSAFRLSRRLSLSAVLARAALLLAVAPLVATPFGQHAPCGVAWATAPSPVPANEGGTILLRNLRVFDPVSGEMSAPRTLRIEGGVIVPERSSRSDGPRRQHGPTRAIDCTGKCALPGLFDCHTHLSHLLPAGEDSLRSTLAAFVRSGVLCVRDVGGPLESLARMRKRITDGDLPGPEIFYTGPMLEASPLTWEKFNRELPGFTVAVDTEATADSLIPALAAGGATCVKTFNKFDPAVYRRVVSDARRAGLRIVHDPGMPLFQAIPMDQALDYGVRCIEHAKSPWPVVLRDDLRQMHEDARAKHDRPAMQTTMMRAVELAEEGISRDRLRWLGERMADRDAFLCPTLAVFSAMAEQGKSPADDEGEMPPEQREMMKKVLSAMEKVSRVCVRELGDCGVRMLVGQDGCDPKMTAREMLLLRECGIPEVEILRGATLYPAIFLGTANRMGRISEGRSADLVILEGNPLEDIGAVGSPFLVIQGGRIVAEAL